MREDEGTAALAVLQQVAQRTYNVADETAVTEGWAAVEDYNRSWSRPT